MVKLPKRPVLIRLGAVYLQCGDDSLKVHGICVAL